MIAELSLLFGVMIVLIVAGVPLFASMGLGAGAYILVFWPKVPTMIVGQGLIQGLDNYNFAAILFFFLAGEIMNAGGISDRLLRFTRACFGHIRGGLSHVTVISGMVFAGVSGSAVADASAIGSVMIPALKRDGYPPAYAAAVTAAAASIGPVIPPSIPLVIFGLMANTSVAKLFLAGVVPGILMGVFLLVASSVISRRRGYPAASWAGWREIGASGLRSLLALFMPVIVIGGIVSGIATVTEIGAIAAAYAILVSMFVYRELDLQDLWRVLVKAGVDGCKILIIASFAGLLIWIVGNLSLAQILADWVGSVASDPTLVLALIAFLLFVGGMVIEPIILLLVFLPIFIPAVIAVGIDLTHFGIVAVMATLFGLVTPPVGLLIFLTAAQADAQAHLVVKELLPFLLALVLLLAILILVPGLSLWLPNMLLAP
jgi:tripartite ATP-independent transporter DctM subunit